MKFLKRCMNRRALNFVRDSVRPSRYLCLQISKGTRRLQAQWASLLRFMMYELLTMNATRLSRVRSAKLLYSPQRTENSTEFSSHIITTKSCTKKCGDTEFTTQAIRHIRTKTDISGMSAEPMTLSKQEASE